jgi:hypothetical protein
MSAISLTSPNHQLLAQLRLRWSMLRSRRLRWAIALIALVPPALVVLGLLGLQNAPNEQRLNLALATPTFYVGFAVLTMLAPLVSGGGYELFPSGQMVAYPIRPATVFRGTLLLAPINLAWVINVIALFVVTGFAVGDPAWIPTVRALLVVAAFVGAATILGHGVGWLVMGIRQSRRGRLATNVLGVCILLAGLVVVWAGQVLTLLDYSPTASVLVAAYAGYQGNHDRWLLTLAVLVVLALLMLRFGDAAASWALRRPGDHADRSSSRPVPRRRMRQTALPALVAVDHASIWRSTPLRRGVLVIVVVPGVLAGLVGMSWQSLILVPGLIAAGAGLLFGINAFTLDSTGSIWLSTLPGWARPAFLAKSLVFGEIALAAVFSALIGGSLRAPQPSSMAEVTAAVGSAVSCAIVVVAIGMRSSLRHPHRAELEGPRDTPATPGVMAAQSIRFATVTTLTSLYFAGLSVAGDWWLPLVGAVPVVAFVMLHLRESARAWEHPHVRAFVVTTVSGG